jgi:hypothetical protein
MDDVWRRVNEVPSAKAHRDRFALSERLKALLPRINSGAATGLTRLDPRAGRQLLCLLCCRFSPAGL